MKTLLKPILASLLFAFSNLAWTAPIPLDKIIAVVDDEIILQSDLEEALAQFQSQPGFAQLSDRAKRSRILDQLIDNKILLAIARTDTSIVVTEDEIERTVQMQVERQQENNGGKYRFAEMLQQYYGMSIEDFREQMRQRMEEQSLVQKLQLKYIGNLEPSSKQVREFYESYKDSLPALYNNIKISHLEVSVRPSRVLERAAYKKADSLIQLLTKGADFEELAKQVSDDPTKIQGGDLGYIKRGSLDPDYERAAFRLSVGDYTPKPIRTRYGFHVIKSTGKRDVEVRTSHILVLLTPSKEDTLRTVRVLDSLRLVALESPKGEGSFSNLASRISEDKKTKALGGSLGWFVYQNLNPSYKDIVDTLTTGGISEPVWVDEKYHLFKVDERMETRTLNLEEDWKQISFIAKNYAIEQKLKGYLEDWRKKVYIANYSGVHVQGEPLIFTK